MDKERKKDKRLQYEHSSLVKAVQAVKEEKWSVCKAAKVFGVPPSTVSDHVNGKVKEFSTVGKKSELSIEEEAAVVKFIEDMAERNMPLQRKELRHTIVTMIRAGGPDRVLHSRVNLENGPSDGWFRGFSKRHPEIKWCVPETMDRERSSQSNEYVMDQFFNQYETLLTKNGLIDKPSQIFNCDETAVNSHKTTHEKAYGMKGNKLYQKKMASHDHITVMMVVSAAGKVLPSMILYGQNMPSLSVEDKLPTNWLFGTSPKGYMDRNLFKQWFQELFLKHCGPQRPIVLILDNHDSHISFDVLQCAVENQVHILGLPSHTTHILQPLDVGIFGPLKRKYNQICVNAGLVSKSTVKKSTFPIIWKNAIDQGSTPNIVKSAFRRAGIYPFDPCAIDDSKLSHAKLIEFTPMTAAASVITPPEEVPSTSAPSRMTDVVREKNQAVGHIEFTGDPCVICNHKPHPIDAVRKLPPDLQIAFPVPNLESTVPKKRRVSTPLARTLTSQIMMTSVKEKEDRIAKEELAKAERKRVREEKKAAKQSSLNKSKQLLTSNNSTDVLEESGCFLCKQDFPPAKGKGKKKRPKITDIDWVQCEHCDSWFHCICLNINIKDLPESFYCDQCAQEHHSN